MKIVLILLICLIVAISARPASDAYTDRWDNVDLDSILNSDRLFNNYFKCLMDRGRCTPDAQELRNVMSDAVETHCQKCNEKQKKNSRKIMRFLLKNKQDQWIALMDKYDPDDLHRARIKEESINDPS